MTNLHILVVDTEPEAQAICSAAENWGATVSVTQVSSVQQMSAYFSQPPDYGIVIISGNSNERGFLLPGTAEIIRLENLVNSFHLQNNIVINMSYLGGAPALAHLFLGQGAQHYLGPVGYPDDGAALRYVLKFLYHYIHNGQDVIAAHLNAYNECPQFSVYHSSSLNRPGFDRFYRANPGK